MFDPSYIELRRLVRVGGFESDIRLLAPGEFHADTTELIQILRKGHHGVELNAEAWDRLVTWIDLNAPCHGTWQDTAGVERTRRDHLRRIDLRRTYGGPDDDPEVIPDSMTATVNPVRPKPIATPQAEVTALTDWPFDAAEARRRQSLITPTTRTLELGNGVRLELLLIPAGRFVMGDGNGESDERPLSVVEFKRPFWMSKYEVDNEQYRQFDPAHDSRYEHKGSWSFSEGHLGWKLNGPRQPVVRISQREALAFCQWLSQKIGAQADLPTEA
ncbi:MAG: SUMF1/EgtB/PvdO family nonheme iron enzyme, partial [Verrucomicrobia bacterium]|nr:SUMF1/EgtB/PvdO family nonheme iron enzyme [Verrucomicrobiota bacterium]